MKISVLDPGYHAGHGRRSGQAVTGDGRPSEAAVNRQTRKE
jgi:hypothetical protein